MTESEKLIRNMVTQESLRFFGVHDTDVLSEVCSIWHDDQNKHWRWNEVELHNDHHGKILDMAAGVGTFLLYGLHQGYDIYGVEPEQWKLDYIRLKIQENQYPHWYSDRIIQASGEELPFPDNSFDLITSYQTLEHVQDVEKCISEMLRVLKPGGKLKINAPDYRCWYEPHYLLPFMPRMNRTLAKIYLSCLGKPVAGLATLKWITTPEIISYIEKYDDVTYIELTGLYKEKEISEIGKRNHLPRFIARVVYSFKQLKFVFRREKYINLVIKKFHR